jgi:hypothetical protein
MHLLLFFGTVCISVWSMTLFAERVLHTPEVADVVLKTLYVRVAAD